MLAGVAPSSTNPVKLAQVGAVIPGTRLSKLTPTKPRSVVAGVTLTLNPVSALATTAVVVALVESELAPAIPIVEAATSEPFRETSRAATPTQPLKLQLSQLLTSAVESTPMRAPKSVQRSAVLAA